MLAACCLRVTIEQVELSWKFFSTNRLSGILFELLYCYSILSSTMDHISNSIQRDRRGRYVVSSNHDQGEVYNTM